jgi:hypothetical protein
MERQLQDFPSFLCSSRKIRYQAAFLIPGNLNGAVRNGVYNFGRASIKLTPGDIPFGSTLLTGQSISWSDHNPTSC